MCPLLLYCNWSFKVNIPNNNFKVNCVWNRIEVIFSSVGVDDFFMDFSSRKKKAYGLVSKFSQSHGKLENYNIGLKYKREK